MKRIFTLLLFTPFILMFASGCVKKQTEADTPLILPFGNFKGQFLRIHYTTATKKYDTIRCNINLRLDVNSKEFYVTGDTVVVHAGSQGTYQLDEFYMNFRDFTLASADGKKVHLTGGYKYGYDGDILNIQAIQQDTLKYMYSLKYSKL